MVVKATVDPILFRAHMVNLFCNYTLFSKYPCQFLSHSIFLDRPPNESAFESPIGGLGKEKGATSELL